MESLEPRGTEALKLKTSDECDNKLYEKHVQDARTTSFRRRHEQMRLKRSYAAKAPMWVELAVSEVA